MATHTKKNILGRAYVDSTNWSSIAIGYPFLVVKYAATPLQLVAITGVPQDSASTCGLPHPSPKDGITCKYNVTTCNTVDNVFI